MKNAHGFGGAMKSFGQGVMDALTIIKEPLNVSKQSHPEMDTKRLKNDIKRAGQQTLRDRQQACQAK